MCLALSTMVCASAAWFQAPSLNAQEATTGSEGMIAYTSDTDFATTLARVEPAVKARGLFVMRVLDHAVGAAKFDRVLSPNSVVLFGNPKVGSQVMRCAPRAGIDLPQKLLVWEEDGTVVVAYNDPDYLRQRHSIVGCDELLARVAENIDRIARTVAGMGDSSPSQLHGLP
jgi:uncharacterized protein (DUF302 family)